MFTLPMDIDNQFGIDLVVGSKGGGGSVGWLQAPKAARNVGDWTYHPIYRAGWIMSLEQLDVDEDGDADVVVSDRKGSSRGVLWLENPGPKGAAQHAPWTEHRIGADGMEVMFLTIADIDGDRRPDIVCATRNKQIIVFRRAADSKVRWESWGVDNPHAAPNGKAVRVADVNLDGKVDLIHTVNNGGKRQHRGAVWMSYGESIRDKRWDVHDISGDRGVKFDLIQMLDVDRDGDLDLITCEERDNLGVFWYENPTR
jgi:hypothetical protein